MACQTCGDGSPGSGSGSGPVQSTKETIIRGSGSGGGSGSGRGSLVTIETDSGRAAKMGLTRGIYKVHAEIEFAENNPVFLENQEKVLPVDGEMKRIRYHKIEVKNIRKLNEFKNKGSAIIEFEVIDNVLPLAPIIWGASLVSSGVAGWFFVDKVQKFTETSAGSIISIGASIVGAIVGLKMLTGS